MKTINNRLEDKIKRYSIITIIFVTMLFFLAIMDHHFAKQRSKAGCPISREDMIQLVEMKSYHQAQDYKNLIFFDDEIR